MNTLALDENGDLLTAAHPDGAETLMVISGSLSVAQSAATNISLKRGAAWFNISKGIDYLNLFIETPLSDEEMQAARSTAIREALFETPGIAGFADAGALITFERSGRKLTPNIPCVLIDCESSRQRATIQTIGTQT